MAGYSALLDYERYGKSGSVERFYLDGLICPIAACGTYYMAGETPRAPRAPCLVVICDLVLMQCLLGDAHAAVSCQVKLGDPSPCQLQVGDPIQPIATWRDRKRCCLDGLICLIAACGTFYAVVEMPRATRALSFTKLCGDLCLSVCICGLMMLGFRLRCWDECGVVGRRAKLASCRLQAGDPMSAAAWMSLFAQSPPAALFMRWSRCRALPGH